MNESNREGRSSISGAGTVEEIGEFWDSHSLADYAEETVEVSFELRARRRRRITLDPDLHTSRIGGSGGEQDMGRIEIPKRMEHQFKTLVNCLRSLTRPENMVLAGGTTLEMLWKHRDSTDIDLFVSNRTLMEISQAGKEAKTRAETRIQRVGEIAPEEGPGSGIIKGKIQGVTFSFCASDYIPWHREPSANISGTGVQCGRPQEVLEGKILGRWSDAAKEERGGRTERRWVPARDVYDIAVARRLIPEQLGGTIGKNWEWGHGKRSWSGLQAYLKGGSTKIRRGLSGRSTVWTSRGRQDRSRRPSNGTGSRKSIHQGTKQR